MGRDPGRAPLPGLHARPPPGGLGRAGPGCGCPAPPPGQSWGPALPRGWGPGMRLRDAKQGDAQGTGIGRCARPPGEPHPKRKGGQSCAHFPLGSRPADGFGAKGEDAGRCFWKRREKRGGEQGHRQREERGSRGGGGTGRGSNRGPNPRRRRGKDNSLTPSPRVFKARSLRPPQPLPVPRGEADELAAQGADGDAGATSAAWGQPWAGRAAEGGSLAPAAGRAQGKHGARRPPPGPPGGTGPAVRRLRSSPGGLRGPVPRLGLPGSPSSGLTAPAYLGAGQQPHSTGRHWKWSRSAGAAPLGAGQPRPGCWPSGGHLGVEGSDWEGRPGRGLGAPTDSPDSTATGRTGGTPAGC